MGNIQFEGLFTPFFLSHQISVKMVLFIFWLSCWVDNNYMWKVYFVQREKQWVWEIDRHCNINKSILWMTPMSKTCSRSRPNHISLSLHDGVNLVWDKLKGNEFFGKLPQVFRNPDPQDRCESSTSKNNHIKGNFKML